MEKTDAAHLGHQLASFEGVFCSGCLIADPSLITALALLFDKVHFLNQLEYVIELTKHYRIEHPAFNPVELPSLQPVVPHTFEPIEDMADDPLLELEPEQRRSAHTYLWLTDRFFLRNAPLFPEVFACSLLPGGEVLSAKLVKKGGKGQLNTYQVEKNPLVVSFGSEDELSGLLKEGRVPIVDRLVSRPVGQGQGRRTPTEIAAALAIKTVAMVMPATRQANPLIILEARDKLRDHLPPFWAAMLRLSGSLSERLASEMSDRELQCEVDDAVSTIVRPALIELVTKMEMERKLWFYRILSPVAKGLRVLAGKPPTDLAGLVTSSLVLGANVSMEAANQLRKVEALKQNAGLTYVIELHRRLQMANDGRSSG